VKPDRAAAASPDFSLVVAFGGDLAGIKAKPGSLSLSPQPSAAGFAYRIEARCDAIALWQ